MRFKLDENLPVELAEILVEAGHDAVTVLEERMGGAEDPSIAAICLAEGRILITLDTDFADIRTYPPRRYAGIVVLRLHRQSRDYLLQIGNGLLTEFASASPQGQLWIVEDSRVRIRE